MRRSTAIVFVFLMLCWASTPLLACVGSSLAMTPQEHQCCVRIAQMCGSANMPQSHSCCKTDAQPSSTTVTTTEQQSVSTWHVIDVVPASSGKQVFSHLRESEHHHPPGEFLPETTVIRI
jgi:hypothetical protein